MSDRSQQHDFGELHSNGDIHHSTEATYPTNIPLQPQPNTTHHVIQHIYPITTIHTSPQFSSQDELHSSSSHILPDPSQALSPINDKSTSTSSSIILQHRLQSKLWPSAPDRSTNSYRSSIGNTACHSTHRHIHSSLTHCSQQTILTASTSSQLVIPDISRIPTPFHHTSTSSTRSRPPIHSIWFSHQHSNIPSATAALSGYDTDSTMSDKSTDSSSMYSTSRLWAETFEEMGISYERDSSINSSPANSTQSDHLSPSELLEINRIADQRVLQSTQSLWNTIVQDIADDRHYSQIMSSQRDTFHQDSISVPRSTTTTCLSTDSIQSQARPPADLPRTFFFENVSLLQQSPRNYKTYPDDDAWSVSSVTSNVTCSTADMTDTDKSVVKDLGPETPFLNPRFMGNMAYYFPPRLLASRIVNALPSNDNMISNIESHDSMSCDSQISWNSNDEAPANPVIGDSYNTLHVPSNGIGTGVSGNAQDIPSTYLPPIPINISEPLYRLQSSTTLPSTPLPSNPCTMGHGNAHHNPSNLYQSTIDQCWDSFQSSTTLIKPNESWGDPIDVKCDGTVRIYFQNVNSLGLSQNCTKLNTVLQSMKQVDCDIVNVVQTSINWRFLHIRNRLRTALSRIYPIHKVNVSRNKFSSEQAALPGGCAQIIQGDWSGRVVEYVHDFRHLGRWCGTKLRLKSDRHLYVITAYRVCNQHSASIGPETAYRQQELLLALDGFVNPDPRKQFIVDLTVCIKKWQTEGDEVLLSLDANEQLGDSSNGLTQLMRDCRLIDIFHHHHGVCPSFETFDLGTKRLDYIVGSADLLPFVNRCGYLAFYHGIPSDHRGLYVDLNPDLIDGLTRLERTPTRYLHSSFQKDIYQYKKRVHTEFVSHHIYDRAKLLYTSSTSKIEDTEIFRQQLAQLDKLILDIQLKAEVKCCKKRTKYDWSDDIYFTKKCILYWCTKRKNITRRRDTVKICQAIYDLIPQEHRQYIDIATGSARSNWFKTKARLKLLMVHHRKTMTETKHHLLDNEARYTGTTVEKVQAKKDRIQKDKKLYNTLRHHFHPSHRSGITHLLLPDKDIDGHTTNDVDSAAHWRMESQPEQVLHHLFARNITHFGQAQGTPFTVAPLVDQLGYTGITPIGTNIIQEGIFPNYIQTEPSHAHTILQHLSEDHTTHCQLDDLISFENFHKSIRKWSESTSTSPSGKHLGHYKSLIAIDSNSSAYIDDNPDPGMNILQVLYQVAASAFQSGQTIPRWQKVSTCMIEKLPGIPKINKLRVIHLYEADYNAFNKMIWQRGIVWEAHKKNTLNPAQSGSRPNHNCIDVVMSKGHKYLYSQLTRTSMATMDNDAKSCYDRMVANLALLVSHKFGVPTEFCQTVGETLRTMQFSIRTAMGDSSKTYCHGSDTPIHGVGQGGTASPAFWLLVSSIMFDCYQRSATGMTMKDPTGVITIRQWLEALVDDTSLFTNLPIDTDLNRLVRTLEADTQEWERFLSASGGCLELSKCFYYVLAWTFNSKGDPSPMTLAEIEAITSPITLQEYDKLVPTPITSKPPQEAHKTLGVWMSMDGNVKQQIEVLRDRSNNLSNIVSTSGLYPYQADVALRMIYMPAMCYSLPAVSISESALDKIQSKAMAHFVPALGYNKSHPRAFLLGPPEFGGMGIPHLYTEMNVAKLEYLIMNIRHKSELGNLFRINLNWVQLHIGISPPLFEYPHEIPYISNWFIHLHAFVRRINARLVIKDTYTPSIEREFDICIMEAILKSSLILSKRQLQQVYNWRIYFNVHKLSDLTTARGDRILPMYLNFLGDDTPSPRTSKVDWPHQSRPTCKVSFQLWTRCLRHCFLQGRSTSLVKPLGKWLVHPSESESKWDSYIHTSYQSVVIRHGDHLKFHSIIQRSTGSTTTFDATQYESVDSIPDHYIPVTTRCTDTSIVATHSKQRILSRDLVQCRVPTDIIQSVQVAPTWKQHLLQHFHIPDPSAFSFLIQDSDTKLIVVSDGGLSAGTGSFGVAFGTFADNIGSIEGPAPGNSVMMTSLRSEAYGALAALAFLNLYVKTYSLTIPQNRRIFLYSDNLGLVRWLEEILSDGCYPRMHLRAEADVLIQIKHELEVSIQSNFSIHVAHVKGHQDDVMTYNELSREAQLNIQADLSATNYIRHGVHHKYEEFDDNPISLYICDLLISRDFKNVIRCASRSPELRIYLTKKYNWKDHVADLIWWQVHAKAIKSFSNADQRRIRKYIVSWVPTCARLFRFGLSPTPECPSCGSIETQKHLIFCNCNNRLVLKNKWLYDFDRFLSNDRYTPTIIRHILYNQIIYAIYPDCDPPEIPDCNNNMINRAVAEQTQIGWNQLLFGRISLLWGSIIGNQLSANNVPEKEMSINRWGKIFIKHFYQLMLDIWISRNLDGHCLNDRNESILSRQRIMGQILQLQESNPDVRYYCDRDFVFCPIETFDTYSLANLQSWYRSALSILRAQRKYRNVQPSIRDSFPVLHPTPIPNTTSPAPPPDPVSLPTVRLK